MKRIISVLLGCCLLASLATGCGSSSQPAAASTPANTTASAGTAGTPTKFNIWVFNELHNIVFNGAAESWNKNNPDRPIELSIEAYPNAEMHNKLLMAIQANAGAPDIVDINVNYFANFLKGDNSALIPLNDIVEKEIDNCVQSRFDIYSKNGTYYGIPTLVGAAVVYYNTDIMNAAGVDIDSIKTWDQYVAAGKEVLAKTNKPMTAFEVSNQRPFWPLIVQNGSDYLDENNNVTLDSQENIDVLNFMSKMVFEDKIAIPMPGNDTSKEEFWTFMNSGGMASLIMPSWYMARFTSYMPDLKGKVAIRPMPVFKEGQPNTVGVGGTGTAITNQCKDQELAKEFLAWAKLSEEAGIRIFNELGFDAVRLDVWDNPAVVNNGDYFIDSFAEVMLPYVKENCPSPNFTESVVAAQDEVNSKIMFKVFIDKSATPEEALKTSAEELRKQQ